MRVVEYLMRQERQSPQSTNCGSSTYVDHHATLWEIHPVTDTDSWKGTRQLALDEEGP